MSKNFDQENIISEPTDIKQVGINKHLYSTNPSNIVGENIYSTDKSSLDKDTFSYQTVGENRKVIVDPPEKENPFNVKGVPGCRECGGSGWKADKKYPHPCNECAKKTVPVIDTYLTKVATPVDESKPSHMFYEGKGELELNKYVPESEIISTENMPPIRKAESSDQNERVGLQSSEEITVKDTVYLPHKHDVESVYKGLPECDKCKGEGYVTTILGLRNPCNECIEKTGKCPLCYNTGKRVDNDKKCNCKYGK